MPGTKAGGLAAAATNKEKYGPEFYKQIGSKGGKNGVGSAKGFATNRELASQVGAIGGSVSGYTKRTTKIAALERAAKTI